MVSAKTLVGRRVLDDGGPLVVGGEQRNGAWHGGVTVSTSACDNPECRTVFLTGAIARAPRAKPAREPGRMDEKDRFSAFFDIDTGRITADPEAPPDPDDEDLLRLLDHEVSEAVQTVLRRRWRQAKGLEDRTSWRDRDWSWWEPGNLVSHCMVFPDQRDVLITEGGRTFWAENFYCVNSRCACQKVLLDICDISEERAVSVGTIEVDYKTLRLLEASPEFVSKSRLRRIWSALEEQMDPWDEFRKRHEEMKAFGDDLAKLVTADREGTQNSLREDAGDASGSESTGNLSCEEILERLTFIERPFPHEVVQAAVERREEITPHLLKTLNDTITRAEELRQDEGYFAHMYALHLLAQFRERRAYPLAIRLASLPEETVEDLFGDFSSDGLHQILGSVAHGEPGPALELAADRSASRWTRVGAAQSLLVMIVAGDLERSDAIACFREILRRIIRDARENDRECIEFCSAIAEFLRALRPEELMEEIAELYELDLVDEYWVPRTSVERALDRSAEASRKDLEYWNSPIVDTVEELKGWGCFTEDVERSAADLKSPSALLKRPSRNDSSPSTSVREAPKVGRNDPCPCGSGKKYKRCCLKRP